MAAYSDVEDSSSDDILRISATKREVKNCLQEINSSKPEKNKQEDLKGLSDSEFLDLLKEATTFDGRRRPESAILRHLRQEVDERTPLLPQSDRSALKKEDQQSKSKFYIEPIQVVPALEEEEDQRFPLLPWTSRPFQVQSFIPVDDRGDKQLLSSDINGNPFHIRSPSIGPFFSPTTLLDYGGAEGRNRRIRRPRNADRGVLSESIAGHRGEEDIDSLLQFINSSDKKAKDKKKSFAQKGHKVKKKLIRSNSLESLSSFPFEHPETVPDINCNEADASFAPELYEETGFLVVKRRQRKRSKRSEAFRWRKGDSPPSGDSRRKSTGSVPHSENSSPDNSDLDSVHSLPVRGSVPHPTRPHPHTTPSSGASTPRASYADIARSGHRRPLSRESLDDTDSCMMCDSGARTESEQPPVIMDPMPDDSYTLSFGFGVEEILQSERLKRVVYGRNEQCFLHYKEIPVNSKMLNLLELVTFLRNEFLRAEKDLEVCRNKTNCSVLLYNSEES